MIEIRSQTDAPADQQDKLERWLVHGVRLGWLIDALERSAYIYRPAQQPERLERPQSLSGEDVLPGLAISLAYIWPAAQEQR